VFLGVYPILPDLMANLVDDYGEQLRRENMNKDKNLEQEIHDRLRTTTYDFVTFLSAIFLGLFVKEGKIEKAITGTVIRK